MEEDIWNLCDEFLCINLVGMVFVFVDFCVDLINDVVIVVGSVIIIEYLDEVYEVMKFLFGLVKGWVEVCWL